MLQRTNDQNRLFAPQLGWHLQREDEA
ncbi:hypothetical protein CPC197_0398A, partial [Chlamydia psittaci C1/97]